MRMNVNNVGAEPMLDSSGISNASMTAPSERAGSLLAGLLRSSRRELALAVASGVLGGLGGTLLVTLFNRALAAPSAERPRLGLTFAGFSVLMLVMRWLSKSTFVRLGQSAVARLRRELGRHWAQAPYRDIEALGQGRLFSVLIEDVAAASRMFMLLPRLVTQGAVIVGCLAYLAWLSWPAFAAVLAAVLIGSAGRYRVARHADRRSRRAREHEDALYTHFRALFAGAKELALHRARREAFVSQVIGDSVEAVRLHATAGDRSHVHAIHWGVVASYAVLGIVAFPLAELLELSIDVRSGYALVLLYMMLPVHSVLSVLPEIAHARLAFERLQALGLEAESSEPPAAAAVVAFPGPVAAAPPRMTAAQTNVALRGVTHRYRREMEDGAFVLGPIDLELRAGEIVFLVGGNGSGKTTLAKLLVGLYEPETGEVLLDGVRVAPREREAYRQNFSAVFSDFHVFDRLLGHEPRKLDERAQGWLRALDLEHKVKIEGGVLSTTELSSGQRKRLALLAAVLEERPVCCFDEWAADQDPAYKQVFYQTILPALAAQGRAVFVISHDERYFHLASRCLKLEAGKLRPLCVAPPPIAASVRADHAESSERNSALRVSRTGLARLGQGPS
jgi:putative ATP-binding cassette transporter